MPKDIFHKRGTVGCLLIHGFTGSQNEFLSLSQFLADNKITVLVPTLPGHATHAADLFNYTWRDWFEHVKQALARLQSHCDEVFVCGQSMGGTLALHLAAHKRVQGVIALAAPVTFPAWKKHAVKFLKHVLRYRYKRNGEDIRDESARARLMSYRRYPYSAVDQLFQLTDHVRADVPEIEQPLLIIHARRDHTVSYDNSYLLYHLARCEDKRRIALEESYHIITEDVERERVLREVLDFITQRAKKPMSAGPRQKQTKVSGKKSRSKNQAGSQT